MPSKFLNLSTDTTLGGATPSDELAVSQRAIKLYVDSQSGGGSGSAQSVGNVFWTMRTDNELNGAVECNGATYNTTDFTGAQSIGQLLADGKVPYVSLTQYATLLSTQGSCGVFGWDGGSTTEFRVPSLNDIFIETGTAAQIGDYIAPGLPNITGQLTGIQQLNPTATGAFSVDSTTSRNTGTGHSGGGVMTIGISAQRSSSIYGNSLTVQPNTVRYRAMVQLATGATDEALETCTGVLADVANLQQNKVSKGHEVIEFQEPTAANNYTWYRKYADGWVEQGGNVTLNTTFVSLPVPMSNKEYQVKILPRESTNTGNTTIAFLATTTQSTNGFGVTTSSIKRVWEVKGMAA